MAKKEMSKTKNETFERLYQHLNTKERAKDIYKIIKAREMKIRDYTVREMKIRDYTNIKCIKDEYNRILVNDEKIRVMEENFHQLFNKGLGLGD